MKLDMHRHTKEGSPDGKLELLENIAILKQKGYQGMLITASTTPTKPTATIKS